MTTSLQRLTVALASRYRLERELGAGGMATVYLASLVRWFLSATTCYPTVASRCCNRVRRVN